VRSEEGKGSTFIMFLPIPPDDSVDGVKAAERASRKNKEPVESGV
jgi:hypothetical protein